MSGNIPYIGSKISLITTSDIRYEGILYTLNREESTIAVQNVRSFGTEGRRIPEVPMSNEIYDFIIFRGKDLKDLTVLQGAPERQQAYTGVEYLDASNPMYPHGLGQAGYMQDQCGPAGSLAPGAGMHVSYQPNYQQARGLREVPYQGSHQQAAPAPYPQQPIQTQLVPPAPLPFSPHQPQQRSASPGRGASAEAPATSTSREEDDKAKGRSKGGGQKKPVFEVLRFHRRAEESLTRAVKAQGAPALNPAELRAMSETNPPVYHFYLDYVNYCCSAHLAQSDEQQWETLSKALKKHFERDICSGPSSAGFTSAAGQQKPPPQPQRPNNTLGDFISLEAAAARPGKKGVKAARGAPLAGPAPGRGGKAVGRGSPTLAGVEDGADFYEEVPPSAAATPGGGSWACPRCTLRNEVFLTECAACGTSKQQAALWAEFPPLA